MTADSFNRKIMLQPASHSHMHGIKRLMKKSQEYTRTSADRSLSWRRRRTQSAATRFYGVFLEPSKKKSFRPTKNLGLTLVNAIYFIRLFVSTLIRVSLLIRLIHIPSTQNRCQNIIYVLPGATFLRQLEFFKRRRKIDYL
jgi:hypothetical protein